MREVKVPFRSPFRTAIRHPPLKEKAAISGEAGRV